MREAEQAKRNIKYKERKPIPHKYIIIGYVVILALLLFSIFAKNKFLLFLFVMIFSTIFNYQTNMTTIRFNPDPEVFSSLIITKLLGFNYALFMLFLPTLFVDIYTARLDKDTFISFVLTIAINYFMHITKGVNFVVFGIILVTIKFVVGLIANMLLDISPQEIIFEHVLGFVSNLLFFLTFGARLIRLFT